MVTSLISGIAYNFQKLDRHSDIMKIVHAIMRKCSACATPFALQMKLEQFTCQA